LASGLLFLSRLSFFVVPLSRASEPELFSFPSWFGETEGGGGALAAPVFLFFFSEVFFRDRDQSRRAAFPAIFPCSRFGLVEDGGRRRANGRFRGPFFDGFFFFSRGALHKNAKSCFLFSLGFFLFLFWNSSFEGQGASFPPCLSRPLFPPFSFLFLALVVGSRTGKNAGVFSPFPPPL